MENMYFIYKRSNGKLLHKTYSLDEVKQYDPKQVEVVIYA